MPEHVVTARGTSVIYPYIVATHPDQHRMLIDFALHDPRLGGVHARTHFNVMVHVSDRPIIAHGQTPLRWLQVGYFAQFGGALFVDETVPDGADWAWLAVRPKFLHSTPAVYFDQDSETQFPPRCVMTMNELREVALDWSATGERPASIAWQAVNSFRWKLDGAGDLAPSPDMT
jgi:hypothetical protein